jgi:hypothetical protein
MASAASASMRPVDLALSPTGWVARDDRVGALLKSRCAPWRSFLWITRQRNLLPHLKIFLQKRLPQKGYPFLGRKSFLARFLGEGA